MEVHEQAFRQLFASPFGPACGQAIIDGISEGKELVIDMTDGSVHNCAQLFEAIAILRQFGWNPPTRGVR
jgi:hypothetical protein